MIKNTHLFIFTILFTGLHSTKKSPFYARVDTWQYQCSDLSFIDMTYLGILIAISDTGFQSNCINYIICHKLLPTFRSQKPLKDTEYNSDIVEKKLYNSGDPSVFETILLNIRYIWNHKGEDGRTGRACRGSVIVAWGHWWIRITLYLLPLYINFTGYVFLAPSSQDFYETPEIIFFFV